MEAQRTNIIQEYDDLLTKDEMLFLEKSDELNEKYSKGIYNDIVEEIYMLKGVNIPQNDPRLIEKIKSEIVKIIDEYGYVINANKNHQKNGLGDVYQGMPIEQMPEVKEDQIDLEKDASSIKSKIVDKVLTYFNYENQRNSMYWEKSRQVEDIVRQKINTTNIMTIMQQFDSIYKEIIQQMMEQRAKFINEFALAKTNDQVNDNTSLYAEEVAEGPRVR